MNKELIKNTIGIDRIGLYFPPAYFSLNNLAQMRQINPEKYSKGLGQTRMSCAPLTQDTVSMAANAALDILESDDLDTIDLLIVATESAVDHSKATAVWVHKLLNLHPHCRSLDMRQACYSGTAALDYAYNYIALHPGRRSLIIASDIAYYGADSKGEPTQGAGAVALLMTENPRLFALDNNSVFMTEDIFDFWRPNYKNTPEVDGKYSVEKYTDFFLNLWNSFKEESKLSLSDFTAFCFHVPYSKLTKKTLELIENESDLQQQTLLSKNLETALLYSEQIGNIYTGSLYLSLLSLLENATDLVPGDRIALYSYGSGAVAELFSGTIANEFKSVLQPKKHKDLLENRQSLSVEAYEKWLRESDSQLNSDCALDLTQDNSSVVFGGIKDHKRFYERR